MSRFVKKVPETVRYLTYAAAIAAAIEVIASLIAALFFTAFFAWVGNGIDPLLADPVGVLGTMIVGFQTFIFAGEVIRYVFASYVSLRSALFVAGVSTTIYVASMVLVWLILRRLGVRDGRDVDALLEGRKA